MARQIAVFFFSFIPLALHAADTARIINCSPVGETEVSCVVRVNNEYNIPFTAPASATKQQRQKIANAVIKASRNRLSIKEAVKINKTEKGEVWTVQE